MATPFDDLITVNLVPESLGIVFQKIGTFIDSVNIVTLNIYVIILMLVFFIILALIIYLTIKGFQTYKKYMASIQKIINIHVE